MAHASRRGVGQCFRLLVFLDFMQALVERVLVMRELLLRLLGQRRIIVIKNRLPWKLVSTQSKMEMPSMTVPTM